jgi:CHAT domain-containing protein
VIGTQWAVNDAASALLAAKFYEQHIDTGLAPAAALKTAQIWLKGASPSACSDFVDGLIAAGRIDAAAADPILGYLADMPADPPPFSHPYFWGGFQLYGA